MLKISFNQLFILLSLLKKFIKKIKVINNEIILDIIDSNNLITIVKIIKKHYKLKYKVFVDLITVDYLKKNNKRFLLNYLFLSLVYNMRLRIQFLTTSNSTIPSLINIYKSANWLERENWDLYGIFFKNHPDLRRILTDYGFEGFPFRKDFPLSGYVELRYDETSHLVVYDNLELTQEIRIFEFISPWELSYKNLK